MKQKVSVPFMLLGILFNVCLIAANLLETKVIQVFGITVTAGLLVFPISYIINDCIAEVWGFRKARLIIWSGFAMNFFVVMLGLIAVALPAAPFWDGAAHFNFVFGIQSKMRITIFQRFLWRHFWGKRNMKFLIPLCICNHGLFHPFSHFKHWMQSKCDQIQIMLPV